MGSSALKPFSRKPYLQQPKSNNVGEMRKSPTKLVDGRG
jgi:hypothetical protein